MSVSESSLSPPAFTDLPNDVLLHIFSYLPLRRVLCLEYLSQRLHFAISSYLSTLKVLNLYSQDITRDIFRPYNEAIVQGMCPSVLEKLLRRCVHVRSIVYIPSTMQASFCEVTAQLKSTYHIKFVDCKDMLDEVRTRNIGLTLGEVCIASSAQHNLVSTLPPTTSCEYGALNILNVEGITMNAHTLLFFLGCVEISLIRCNLEMDSNSELNALEFPNLSKFVYVEQPGRSASSRIGNMLVKKATRSEKLRVLHVGLSEFSALQVAASGWEAKHLEDLQVMSTGSYSATAQIRPRHS